MLDFLLQSEFADEVKESISNISEKLLRLKTATNEIPRTLDFILNPEVIKKNEKLTTEEK